MSRLDCDLPFRHRNPGAIVYHHVKSSSDVNLDRNSIAIIQTVTDEGGTLKIKRLEEFTDSRTYINLTKASAVAKASGAPLAV